MTQVMTPSGLTDGQIDKAADILRATLRKQRAQFGSDAAQHALGQADLGPALLAVFGDRVAAAQKDIARKAMRASLAKNEHGHYTFEITGLDLFGEAEVARLIADDYRVSDYAKSCFTSTKKDGYGARHRLVKGQTYKIALVLGREIARDAERTTRGIQEFAAKFGYRKPLAGIVPRIRETVSDDLMKELDIWYIAALHDPIQDSDGDPDVLHANRLGVGRWVDAFWGLPGGQWLDRGAFAFLVPASA